MLKRFARWVLEEELRAKELDLDLIQNALDRALDTAAELRRKLIRQGRQMEKLEEVIDTYRQGRAVELKDAAFAGRIRTGNGTVIDTALTYDEIALPGTSASIEKVGPLTFRISNVSLPISFRDIHEPEGAGVELTFYPK